MSATKDTAKLAETYDKLYSETPRSVSGEAKSGEQAKNNREAVRDFLAAEIPPSDQKEIESELKKTLALRKQRSNKKIKQAKPTKSKSKGKVLTARERRNLGLYRLPKKCMKFEDLKPLNALWVEYITDLVDFSKWKGPAGDENVQMRLCRADYHGGLVKVSRSKNAGLVGTEGFVVMETRNTFRLLCRNDVIKTVPKCNTSFTFRVGSDHVFTVGGNYMMMKPSDRAVKKWKSKKPFDL